MKKAIIYTTPTCTYCKMAKEFFEKNNISYEEKDVWQDEKARDEMIAKSNQLGVPVIDIEGDIVIGFNQNKLSELLAIK